MMEDTERLIKEQLKKGNEEAYKYLYKNHYALLCHVAYGYVSDDFLAETVVGDVIFHLWEVRESLDIQASLRGYLVKAVRNRCLDYLSSKYEKSEVAFSALGESEIMKEHYLLSDNYPLGNLLARVDGAERRYIEVRHFDANKGYLFPIPQKERDLNKNLDQNPNW